MWIDFQIPAHLCQKVSADFLLPILECREFFAEVQPTVAALTLVGDEFTIDVPAPCQRLYSSEEFRALQIALSDTYVRTSRAQTAVVWPGMLLS